MRTLFKTTLGVTALAAIMALLGCEETSTLDSTARPAGETFANIAGHWSVVAGGYRWEMTLEQDGGTVTGRAWDPADGFSMPVTGTVDRTSVWLKGGEETVGTGEVDGDTMSGKRDWSNGHSSSHSEWSATRLP